MKIVNKKQDNIIFVSDTIKGNIYEIEGQKDNYFICADWCSDDGYGGHYGFNQEGRKDSKFYSYYTVGKFCHKMFINIANGDIYIVPKNYRAKEVNAEVYIQD